MPLRLERSHQNQRIELIVTANVGPVWLGQHLEHNAQRQNAPTHSTRYFAITIEGKKIPPSLRGRFAADAASAAACAACPISNCLVCTLRYEGSAGPCTALRTLYVPLRSPCDTLANPTLAMKYKVAACCATGSISFLRLSCVASGMSSVCNIPYIPRQVTM